MTLPLLTPAEQKIADEKMQEYVDDAKGELRFDDECDNPMCPCHQPL